MYELNKKRANRIWLRHATRTHLHKQNPPAWVINLVHGGGLCLCSSDFLVAQYLLQYQNYELNNQQISRIYKTLFNKTCRLCHRFSLVFSRGNISSSSANGEIVLWENGELNTLQTAIDKAVNCLAFSHDGKYLAIGGQDGKVKIWCENKLITTLENAPIWVDQLAWSYTHNYLAFSLRALCANLGPDTSEVIATLEF